MTNIFGKYRNYNTLIHRMDPRIKIFGLIVIIIVCFLPYGNLMNTILILGILALVIILLMILSKSSFLDFLKSLKVMWIMAIFLLIINLFVPNSTYNHPMIIFSNGYTLYYEGLLNTFMVLVRLILMIALTLVLTSTTTPMDITFAFEWYMYPLKFINFPISAIAMTLSLALRFIPTLLEEADRIMKAQKSRGVDYNRGFISKKIKSITTLIVPLLVSCFSISDDLTLALEARGYDPYEKRSRYQSLKFSIIDLFAVIFIILILAFFICVSVIAASYNINILEYLFPVIKGATF